MQATAVVMHGPGRATLDDLELDAPGPADVVVDIAWSGISAGTERLLWTGRMPAFPGMGYPLVPGYESVGHVATVGDGSAHSVGDQVFVPGAACFGAVRGLFGGAASRVVVPGARLVKLPDPLDERGTLLALAATAHHAIAPSLAACAPPSLVVGHGVLGRLIARLLVALDVEPPTVIESRPDRRHGAHAYRVASPDAETRRDHASIVDASGDPAILDSLFPRLARGGEIVLAGFYPGRVDFAFAPAFMREARLRCAAEWAPADLDAVIGLVASGRLSLDGLITHRRAARDADAAYRTAFDDPACLKMILDWRAA